SPLAPDAALTLFAALLGRPLTTQEQGDVEMLCAVLGYLPQAIEAAAMAVVVEGVPLHLMVALARERPLDVWLSKDGASARRPRGRLRHLQDMLPPTVTRQFALLPLLGSRAFSLEAAAALFSKASVREFEPLTTAEVAHAAAELGQLVRHSLLDYGLHQVAEAGSLWNQCYRLHPLLYAYAQDRLGETDPQLREEARRNLGAYALWYVERHQQEVLHLESQRAVLLAALQWAQADGDDALA